MTPLVRLLLLALVALPVFSGWPPWPIGGDIVPGVAWAPVLSAAIVLAAVTMLCGSAFLASTLAVTALILVPIVFVGGTVSWFGGIFGGAPPLLAATRHGAHYVGLALNMLAVIPLALALVAAVPFSRIEQRLLANEAGIAAWEKYLLMFVRVFHHTVYSVIPNLLDVMREEALLQVVPSPGGRSEGGLTLKTRMRRLTAGLIQVALSGICAALRFIPLWAREIDDLPHRSFNPHRRDT